MCSGGTLPPPRVAVRTAAPTDRVTRCGKRLFIALILLSLAALTCFAQPARRVLTVRAFDDPPVHYRAVAADIRRGERVVISRGSIAAAMRACGSIPGVFLPFVVDGGRLVEGGIADNLLFDGAGEMGANLVIAVECRSSDPTADESRGEGLGRESSAKGLGISWPATRPEISPASPRSAGPSRRRKNEGRVSAACAILTRTGGSPWRAG